MAIHRGAGRGATPQEARRAGALRAAATRSRLKALVEGGVRPEIVKAGWDLVKGRKLDLREPFFGMHEAAIAGDRELAERYQSLLLEYLKKDRPSSADWRDDEWRFAWY